MSPAKSAILSFPAPSDRAAILDGKRLRKMAGSAHAFVRGSTAQFYDWLQAIDPGAVPQAPAVWICGDCHAGNLGPVANAAGKVRIQIRDLDQTVIGNPAYDLIRLGLSLSAAARGSNLPGIATAHMLEEMIRGYRDDLVGHDESLSASACEDGVRQAHVIMTAPSPNVAVVERCDAVSPSCVVVPVETDLEILQRIGPGVGVAEFTLGGDDLLAVDEELDEAVLAPIRGRSDVNNEIRPDVASDQQGQRCVSFNQHAGRAAGVLLVGNIGGKAVRIGGDECPDLKVDHAKIGVKLVVIVCRYAESAVTADGIG